MVKSFRRVVSAIIHIHSQLRGVQSRVVNDFILLPSTSSHWPSLFVSRPFARLSSVMTERSNEMKSLHISVVDAGHCTGATLECSSSSSDSNNIERLCPSSPCQIVNISEGHSQSVELATKLLRGGGVVAVPTDTIYGICCLAQNSAAVDRVYSIKERHMAKPLAICVKEVDDIYRWSEVTVSRELLRELLPGPVTVVFHRSAALNPSLNPDTSRVGVRVPDSPFILDVCRACDDQPLALTSANISSHTSSLSTHEFEELWPRLDAVFDGGQICCEDRSGSTVVDLTEPSSYKIIRDGSALQATVAVLTKYGLSEADSSSR